MKLSSLIEGQLRDAYAKKYEKGAINQSTLADKLGIDRSAVHRRLTGRANMTIETIADMIWGLEHDVDLKIFDPAETATNHSVAARAPATHGAAWAEANTPLMRIASTAPTSNTTGPQVLGGASKSAAHLQTSPGYSEQLAGTK
ncbi:helix-turn-helix domain-containing protein [Bradyrhizobium elkanii]|uniref:helix-turn-helix domain-containing protein n=1 Tax=Bradyrhizobium elkanii TaxID=29448 RepID=UPI002227A64A|nr:helix-turn-helix transcriptional regulator [Bradyrhizobium elkanii]MCW2227221.1 hypothetical protein [Bradyrhizobium elkanii]